MAHLTPAPGPGVAVPIPEEAGSAVLLSECRLRVQSRGAVRHGPEKPVDLGCRRPPYLDLGRIRR